MAGRAGRRAVKAILMPQSVSETSSGEDRDSDDWRTLILAATHLGTVLVRTVNVNENYL